MILHPSDAFGKLREGDFFAIFAAEANAAGYRLADTEKGNLFQAQNTTHAELEVGAGITQMTADGCFGKVLIVRMAEIETTIVIDWQVFDPLEKKLLFRAASTGHAKIESNQYNDTIVEEGTRAAFKDAAKNILANPAFVAAVTDPRAAAPGVSQAAPPATGTVSTQIANLPLRTKSFRERVSDLQRHVVTVRTAVGSGTGFYVAEGLLLTNHHVISGGDRAKIRFLDGREILADVIASDARRDVAMLKTENVGVTGLALRQDKPDLTSTVFVIGSPLGQDNEGTISSGIISAFRTTDEGPMIQSDTAITHGNSGGPMFDDKGNVVAITVATKLDRQGAQVNLNLFIPIADALEKLHIQPTLAPGSAPMLAAAPQAPSQVATLSAPPRGAPAPRQIQVSMYPAAGPVKDGGHSNALAGVVEGVGTSGTFTFARPDGVACNGRWTTLQSKPQSGSLVDKYQKVTGLSASVSGMVGGLAVGACSNSASFQAEYYAVPGADSGFGVATDSDGNVYKLIF